MGIICTGFGFCRVLVLRVVTYGFSADAVWFYCVFLVCVSGGVTWRMAAHPAGCLQCMWRQVFQGRHLAVLTHGVRGHGCTAGKSPCCCTVGERPGHPLEAMMCTGVCVGGEVGSESKEQGGLLLENKTCKPETHGRILYVSCTRVHSVCVARSRVCLRHQSWRHPPGPPGQDSLEAHASRSLASSLG